jgi:putative hydrolase of the HAD superfamily
MIAAVIWDFGGVLTTSPFEAFARFEIEGGLPADFERSGFTKARGQFSGAGLILATMNICR